MLDEIVTTGVHGISQKDLISRLGNPDRITVHRNGKKLEREGNIKIKKEGRNTIYIAKRSIYYDTSLAAFLFGRYSLTELIKYRIPVNIDQNKDVIEQLLFEFSNRVGAFIVFVLIYAMNPNKFVVRGSRKKLNNKEESRLIKKWVVNAIQSFILHDDLLNELKHSLYKSVGKSYHYYHNNPLLETETTNQVFAAFARLYPSINVILENILYDPKTGLIKQIKYRKKVFDYFEKQTSRFDSKNSIEQKAIHVHDFKMIKVKKEWIYKRCSGCGIKKKEPVISRTN